MQYEWIWLTKKNAISRVHIYMCLRSLSTYICLDHMLMICLRYRVKKWNPKTQTYVLIAIGVGASDLETLSYQCAPSLSNSSYPWKHHQHVCIGSSFLPSKYKFLINANKITSQSLQRCGNIFRIAVWKWTCLIRFVTCINLIFHQEIFFLKKVYDKLSTYIYRKLKAHVI